MYEFAYTQGMSPDSPEDMRNAIASFMRLERPLGSFDGLSVAYLERFATHVTLFRAFAEHLDMLRRDRLQRLAAAHRALELAILGRLPGPTIHALVEDVRVNTIHSCLEGRPPSF